MEELVFGCGTCAFFGYVEPPEDKKDKVKERRGFCHFNPPTAVLMPQQSRVAMQQPQMKFISQSIRPPVGESEYCGRWQPDAEMQDKLAAAQTQGKCSNCEGDCDCDN